MTQTQMMERAQLVSQIRSVLKQLVENIPEDQNASPVEIGLRRVLIEKKVRPARSAYRVLRPLSTRTSLTETQRNIYRWLSERPRAATAKDVQIGTQMAEGVVWAALRRLQQLKLVGTTTVPTTQIPPVEASTIEEVLSAVEVGMFDGLTQAQATERLLAKVGGRPVKTRTLLEAFKKGGLVVTGKHAQGNLSKTLRTHKEFTRTASGWTLAA